MTSYKNYDYPHRRYNPLKDEWIIVSPHRALRPWQGQREQQSEALVPPFDPRNPLCPLAQRSSGIFNPDYQTTFVFENDFPALLPMSKLPKIAQTKRGIDDHPLFKTDLAEGECRVLCFHRRSDLHLATMTRDEVRAVVNCWQEQMRELAPLYDWVQIFENRGSLMGCSNPHPHCQIWCSKFLPNEPRSKDVNQMDYWRQHGRPMLVDYAEQELRRRERIVCVNDSWLAVVPFWAVWPYETMLLPKNRHVLRLTNLTESETWDLTDIMQELLAKYDNLFQCPFPYSMGWHQAPTGAFLSSNCNHWQLHAVYLPPLLRSAVVKKFMAGYEMVCEPQRDLTPETAAATLSQISNVHYSRRVAFSRS